MLLGRIPRDLDNIIRDHICGQHCNRKALGIFDSKIYIILQISSVTGPVIGILLFLYKGNNWKYNVLKEIFLIGILLSLPSIFILFLFKDKYTLGKKEAKAHSPRLSSPLINVEDLEDEQCENVDGEGCNVNKLAFGQHEFANKHTIPSGVSKMRYIPYILAIADVISGISAGMTVKFFPLFFADELKLSPTYTNGIYVALPILMSIMARGGQIVAINSWAVYVL